MSKSNKGFASNPIIHKFASAKGGRRKVKKGLAALPPERRKEIASMGGVAKRDNKGKKERPEGDRPRLGDYDLEGILGNIDEIHN